MNQTFLKENIIFETNQQDGGTIYIHAGFMSGGEEKSLLDFTAILMHPKDLVCPECQEVLTTQTVCKVSGKK